MGWGWGYKVVSEKLSSHDPAQRVMQLNIEYRTMKYRQQNARKCTGKVNATRSLRVTYGFVLNCISVSPPPSRTELDIHIPNAMD